MKGMRTPGLFSLLSFFFEAILSFIFICSNQITAKVSALIPPEVNGRILITSIDDFKISVLVQINLTSGSEGMGGATMIIGFDTTSISIKNAPIKNVDYFFHNFCGGNYSTATITRPTENRIWINIDLPFSHSNDGTLVLGGSSWTDIATINFEILNQNNPANIYWLYTSPFWGIYDDDNTTFWSLGQFKDALNVPLPVELSSFTASLLPDKVELNWTTESEVNNYGFDVERKLKDSKWVKLGFVSGNGNSNTHKAYSFIDDSVFGGTFFYYRLKQIDTDGGFHYSDSVEIEFNLKSFSLSQNYPNPFNPSTKIRFAIPSVIVGETKQLQTVNLKVFDVLGNEVATLVNEEMPAGIYEVEFNVSDYSSGIYFYRLQAGSFVETKKMILIK